MNRSRRHRTGPDGEPIDLSHIEDVRRRNGAYIVPFVLLMLVLWATAVYHWMTTADVLGFLLLGYMGLFFGIGVGGYVALPERFRPYARKIVMMFVGVLLLVLALLTDHGNMQIEGLFFALLTGVAPFVIIHYFIAKLAGPLILGRVWCGWACWYGMVFDMLPYPFSFWRRDKRLSLLRYIHFGLSIAVVALLWFRAGFQGTTGRMGVYWFLIGLGFYYVTGIVLALVLKDNRAFCKYVCPISVPMKEVARFSVVKVAGDITQCADTCQTCIEMCPMNIRIKDYLAAGTRVLSTECVMCITCLNVCPSGSLKLSLGVDVGGREYWDHDPSRNNKLTIPNVSWTPEAEQESDSATRSRR